MNHDLGVDEVVGTGAYAASGVEDGADVAAGEGDDGAELVDVLVGALRELGAAAGEPEHGALVLDPVLDGLLDGEALVRRVGEGHVVAAPGPRERRHVPGRRRHQAPQPVAVGGAVPLPVHHVLAGELHGAVLVVARRVVRQRRRARRERRRRRVGAEGQRRRRVDARRAAVVRLEAVLRGDGGGPVAAGRLPGHRGGDAVALAVAAALPRAEHVEEAAQRHGHHQAQRAPRPRAGLVRHCHPRSPPLVDAINRSAIIENVIGTGIRNSKVDFYLEIFKNACANVLLEKSELSVMRT